MKIKSKRLIRAAGPLASLGVHALESTLDYRVAYYDPIIDPAYPNDGKRRIYIFWHCGNCDVNKRGARQSRLLPVQK